MRYMGSKGRIAYKILPVILKNLRKGQWYVEPFVGAFNLMDKIYHPYRIANDYNFYIIELFKALQNGWSPPDEVTEEEYSHIKKHKDQYPAHLVGFVGYACAFGGMWFATYARHSKDRSQTTNYAAQTKRTLKRQMKNLKDVHIYNMSYDELEIPPNSLIYCDPPYADSSSYDAVDSFDHDKFYDWCRQMKNEGHEIYISEYNMPDDFECIWKKKIRVPINNVDDSKELKQVTEKIFTIK